MEEIRKYDCSVCHTKDTSKYTVKGYNLCKDCKKVQNPKTYKCKLCNETNADNFNEGRYTTCKKCLNLQKAKSRLSETKSAEFMEMSKNLTVLNFFETQTQKNVYALGTGLQFRKLLINYKMKIRKLGRKILF